MATFKVNVNLVDLFFTVKDKNGNLVPHLNKEMCTVTEDKTPQTLKSFVAETNQPLTLGIMLDTSGSQQRVLPLEQDAGSQFLQQVLRTKDEAFLISFDVNIDLLQDYTNSPRMLSHAMDKAQINTAGGNGGSGMPGAGGGTVPTVGDPEGHAALRRDLRSVLRQAEPGDRPQGHHHPDGRRGRRQQSQNRGCNCRSAEEQRDRLHHPDRRPRDVLGPEHGLLRLLGSEADLPMRRAAG